MKGDKYLFNIYNMRKTLKITEDLHKKIKIFCVTNDLKMNEWVEKELKKILDNHDNR